MKEHEIRPQELLDRYLELCRLDAAHCFGNDDRYEIPCVACGEDKKTTEFVKDSFAYSRCCSCGTLYQSPRPTLQAFESFYRDSESSRYWAEVFTLLWQKSDGARFFGHGLKN